MRAAHVAGAIIFPVSDVEYDEAIWQLHTEGFPFVLVDRYFPALDCDYVVVDNFGDALKRLNVPLAGTADQGSPKTQGGASRKPPKRRTSSG